MNQLAILPSLAPALPEIILALGILALLMIGVFDRDGISRPINYLAIGLLIASALSLLLVPRLLTTFGGAFVLDPFARFMKVLTLIGSAVAIAMSIRFSEREGFARFELPILILTATLGMMLMISANDLIAVYLGLELQSLSIYVIAAIHRDNVRSTEAGLKYFVLGALSSGMLLYGASLVYGFTGQTSFQGIAAALTAHGASVGLIFGLVFLIAGIAFKVSAVPFHMWTPDVYEGAPTPVTAFMAAAPKVAAMALFIRTMVEPFSAITHDWQQVLAFISIASMVLGSFAAIGQRNIKRLMAYSSIGHMGFALLGLASGTEAGVQGVILYLLIYLGMNLGVFAVIMAMRRGDQMVEEIDDLAGLARTSPMLAFIMAILMFSLAGIPPLAGFFAKFYVFLAAIDAQLYWLAVIGVLASVVGAYYYLRIVKLMYFDDPAGSFEPMPVELRAIAALSGAFVLLYALFGGQVAALAANAAKTFF